MTSRARIVAIGLAGAGLMLARPSRLAKAMEEESSSSRLVMSTTGCGGLAADEIARLLELELSLVTAEIRSGPPLSVQLRCADGRMTITVVDPLTRKRLQREIPTPASEPGRERVVALAVSQLFAASWLELLTAETPPPSPPQDPTPPPSTPALDAARRVAEAQIQGQDEARRARAGISLLAGLGARGRSLERNAPFAAAHLEFALRAWLSPSVGLAVHLGWDIGQAARTFGQVRTQAFTAGGGLAWRWWARSRSVQRQSVGLGGQVVMAAGYGRLRGLPNEPEIPAGVNGGATGELAAGFGPRLSYRRLCVDFDVEVGGMLRPPIGLVAGEAPVTLGGLWVGGLLRLGADLTR